MRAVVVGGGIVGVASACYLRRRGVEVVVAERSRLGAASTGRANGGIRAAFGSPVNVALSRASIPVWESFEAEFGVDLAYRRSGYLLLARTGETADRLREAAAVQRASGVEVSLLDPADAREHCPALRPDGYELAAYTPGDGVADPHLALQGYADAAREAGAELRTNAAVTDVRTDGGEVTGVVVDGEVVAADYVVDAAGARAAGVAAMAGLDLPVVPRRRQLAVVEPDRPVGGDVPLTADLDADVHFRPERDGAAVVGGGPAGADPPADPAAYDRTADLDWAAATLDRAADCAGYFGPESRLRRGWAGLYAVTPDHHPVVCEALPGFVPAAGFSGHGFMHAPATGRVVAELVADGRASTVDVSALAADRFDREDGSPLAEPTVLD